MHKNFIKYPIIGAIYSHYKGGTYKVITLSTHSETGEVLVIYKSLHFGSVYARPLEQWFETVDSFNRFTLVKSID
jgi:hypothetical protein